MNNIPTAIGPYSTYRKTNDLLFTSGQIPLDPLTNELTGENVADQARQCLKNIASILVTENLSLNDVIKFTVFLTDLQQFDSLNQVFNEYLQQPYPARSAIEISALPKQALIEIEAIATFSSKQFI
ncbi:MAG: Rid family detoxifying hydrolase [Lactobacillaceae bacterium]|jgi:2-iminobutanoate/2-iminopropanoate deaminase|nr:Rid family detoxifying hydrolase [Lactobacillaceae bacterium]